MAQTPDTRPELQQPSPTGHGPTDQALRMIVDNLIYMRDRPQFAVGAPPPPALAQAQFSPPILIGSAAIRGTQYDPSKLQPGQLFFETDTSFLYIVSNNSGFNLWVKVLV